MLTLTIMAVIAALTVAAAYLLKPEPEDVAHHFKYVVCLANGERHECLTLGDAVRTAKAWGGYIETPTGQVLEVWPDGWAQLWNKSSLEQEGYTK